MEEVSCCVGIPTEFVACRFLMRLGGQSGYCLMVRRVSDGQRLLWWRNCNVNGCILERLVLMGLAQQHSDVGWSDVATMLWREPWRLDMDVVGCFDCFCCRGDLSEDIEQGVPNCGRQGRFRGGTARKQVVALHVEWFFCGAFANSW